MTKFEFQPSCNAFQFQDGWSFHNCLCISILVKLLIEGILNFISDAEMLFCRFCVRWKAPAGREAASCTQAATQTERNLESCMVQARYPSSNRGSWHLDIQRGLLGSELFTLSRHLLNVGLELGTSHHAIRVIRMEVIITEMRVWSKCGIHRARCEIC